MKGAAKAVWTITLDNKKEPITRQRIGEAFTAAQSEPSEFSVRVLNLLSRIPETVAVERVTTGADCEGQPHRNATLTISGTDDPDAPLVVQFELREAD